VKKPNIFITKVSRKGFDYTKWREGLFEDMGFEELFAHIREVTKDYRPPERVKIL